jgi:DNA-binding HxlR family transcriptional regulator
MNNRRRSDCPIAISLDLVGDRWTLLVLRDMVFYQHQYFQEFMDAAEGIASNTLADRLVRLEKAGVIYMEPDPKDGRRKRYLLTDYGMEAIPFLVDLNVWGAKLDPRRAYPASRLERMRDHRENTIRHFRDRVLASREGAGLD